MKDIVVLYQSKYGSAKKYAEWLREALSCDIVETKKAKIDDIATYDTVISGGGIYAGGIAGLSFLKKHWEALEGKRIAVFAAGASPYDEKSVQELKSKNMKGCLSQVPLFYCRGAWKETEMSGMDKLLCSMLKKRIAKKDPSAYEPWEEALMEASGSDIDWADKENLVPVISWAKQN